MQSETNVTSRLKIDRRKLLTGLSATVLLPRLARAATLTDAAGRAVAIPDRVERIFAAGPPASILLYTFAPELLLGWTRNPDPPQCALLGPGACDKPEVGRLTGRGNTTNLEVLLKLKPDLILDVGTINDTYISLATRVQQETGIPYVLLDGRFDAAVQAYRQLGELTQRQQQAETFARYADTTIKTVKGRIDKIPIEQHPSVYFARGPRGLETGLGGSINVETIEFLGSRNVAGGQRGGMATVSMEQVLAWNPDVIVTIEPDFGKSVRTDPVWAPVKAVQSGRVYLSPRLPFGWVDFPPSVNRLIGLWWLAKALYPAQFPEDLRPLTRDFYQQFYHLAPTDAQIDSVLAGSA
ncbi:MAG TPA: iron ABC transporter substrate-binding protein [Xanthobacteraceae bacterium]|jgi:iron complex transport system substrate-binding protein|nr:iron ABC transporter substrate-binding protein [Xanthobacteraceae bacterium]